ncbi:glycosyltransferase [Caldichromatium japonicum]|uniref:Glycosyltransferase n=1 Tax=Caldichromatium japonicum TaxID=2699430 RepID=A0A6G7VFD0_9GAMM|nr:glycosyltransferase [Caldichromatium japonicum]QIK38749.1 glycosyltransferase [Caldichromatium japonicum]
MSWPPNLQMVASKSLGGAERWFIRFSRALSELDAPAQLAIRKHSALSGMDLGGLVVHRLPYCTTWDPWSRQAVARLIDRVQPAIIQTYMGRATRLTRIVPGKGPVHLARLGGYYALGPYRHAHGWIGNTRMLCDWLVQQGLPANRVYHIYNFIDPPAPVAAERIAELREAQGLPDDAWLLICLGRFVPVKGHTHLLAALGLLPESIAGRPLRLLMLGDGPLAPRLKRQADQLGQSQRILWLGWQADPSPYLQMADLVVFPSLEEETLGNVILESWAWGKPLLTASFRGARELARHSEDAWCVPCADARALAQGIKTLLADPPRMAQIAACGHKRALNEFSRPAIMARYQELYQQLAM